MLRIERDSSIQPQQRARAISQLDDKIATAAAAQPWLRSFLTYDPLIAAKNVRAPALILQGLTDANVPPNDADRLGNAMRSGGNRDVTIQKFPRTNHIFVEDPIGDPRRYFSLPSLRVPASTLGLIADWTVARLGAAPP